MDFDNLLMKNMLNEKDKSTVADYCGFNVENAITVDDVVLTPFSSGTTGSLKCVQLTHGNFNAATATLKE